MYKKKQTFMQGVMILMLSQVIIKLAGLLYKIYLTNKTGFGDTGNAIFSAGFQIYTILLAISSIGVPNTISQLVSGKLAVGDNKGAHRIFKIAIAIFGIIGFLCSCFLFFNAKKLANTYLGIPEAEMTIMSLSPSIFIVSISSVLRGYFNGKEKISVTAHSQSIEQILKTILTIIFVEIFYIISNGNTKIMVAGAGIATTMSTFLSFAYLYILYFKNKKEIWKETILSTNNKKESIRKIIKNILFISLPISLTALLSSINRTIDAFSVINITSKFLGEEQAKFQYGILTGKVEGLVMLPYSFNIAFATSLIPSISASRAKGEMDKAIKRIKFSMLATILIALPCTAILVVFAEPILKLLFPNAYLGASMLKLSSLSILFVAITQTIGGVLQGIKKVKVPIIAIGAGAIIKAILNIILIPIETLNIKGAIIATIASHIVTFIISLIYLKKYIRIQLNLNKFIIKPIIATSIMIITSWCAYKKITILISENIGLIISLMIGIVIYAVTILVLKILSKEEIYMLPYGNKLYKDKKTANPTKIKNLAKQQNEKCLKINENLKNIKKKKKDFI